MRPRNHEFRTLAAAVTLAASLLVTYPAGQVFAKKVTIVWATAQNPSKVSPRMVALFEKENPDIKVRIDNYVWDWHVKILAAAAGGVAPDVVQGWSENWRSLIDRQMFLAVDPYVKRSGFSLAPFGKPLLQSWQKDGKLYSLPMYCWTMGLGYNTTLFAQAGVALPRDEWTQDDFLEAARKLTVRDAGGLTKQWGAVTRWALGEHLLVWIRANGGYVTPPDQIVANKLLLDEPIAIKAMEFVQDLIWRYKVAPTQALTGKTGLPDYQLVPQGRAGMWLEGSHDLIFYAEKTATHSYGFCEPPSGTHGKASVYPQDGYAVMRSTKHPAEAMRFLLFLAGPEASLLRATGEELRPPARRDVYPKWVANHPLTKKGIDLSAFQRTFEYAVPSPQYANPRIVTDTLLPVLQKAFERNTVSIADGVRAAVRQTNLLLGKLKAVTK